MYADDMVVAWWLCKCMQMTWLWRGDCANVCRWHGCGVVTVQMYADDMVVAWWLCKCMQMTWSWHGDCVNVCRWHGCVNVVMCKCMQMTWLWHGDYVNVCRWKSVEHSECFWTRTWQKKLAQASFIRLRTSERSLSCILYSAQSHIVDDETRWGSVSDILWLSIRNVICPFLICL